MLIKGVFYYSYIDYNQDNSFNSNVPGPQDGGFDTSAWGNYTNYYPIQNQYSNNNNTNTTNQSRGNQRPRSNNPRQQTSNNSVVVCCCHWKRQILLMFIYRHVKNI